MSRPHVYPQGNLKALGPNCQDPGRIKNFVCTGLVDLNVKMTTTLYTLHETKLKFTLRRNLEASVDLEDPQVKHMCQMDGFICFKETGICMIPSCPSIS